MEPRSSSITEAKWNSSGPACLSILLPEKRRKIYLLGTALIPTNFHPMHTMTDGERRVAHTKTKPETPPATCESRGLTRLPRSMPWASSPSCSRCRQQSKDLTRWQKRHGFQALWLAVVWIDFHNFPFPQ